MSGVARGKKMRNRRSLASIRLVYASIRLTDLQAHMIAKHTHAIPTWAIPSSPAKHSNPDTSRQQARSARLAGRVRIFAKAKVPDVVPRSTKYGDIPSDERREIRR